MSNSTHLPHPVPEHLAPQLRSGEEAARLLQQLFGHPFSGKGVLHVVAAWLPTGSPPDNPLPVLAIGPHSPPSAMDSLLLGAMRARAEAIVTTGGILRAEPQLQHTFPAVGHLPQVLSSLRRDVLGLHGNPVSVVLSSGRDLNLDHPLFHAGNPSLIYTGMEGQQRLARRAEQRGIEVLAEDQPNVRTLLRRLQERGLQTISIEAGPSTARLLYEEPLQVDELVLSLFLEDQLADEARGPDLLSLEHLGRLLPHSNSAVPVVTNSGRWSCQRLWRRAPEALS